MVRVDPGPLYTPGEYPSPRRVERDDMDTMSLTDPSTATAHEATDDEPVDSDASPVAPAADVASSPDAQPSPDLEPIDLELLNATIDYIRPALQSDGGDMVLLGTQDGKVTIQLVGACGGCPMSTMTLTAGIERILRDRVPGVREVIAV